MAKFNNIPKKYLNQFAKLNKVTSRSKFPEEIEEELIQKGKEEELIYLNEQFKFPTNYLSICQVESNFPEKSETPEKFISTLVNEGIILNSQINTEWQPPLTPQIKICAIRHEGSSVYIKLVEERVTTRKSGYNSITTSYAFLTSMVIHFGPEELIELRCSPKDAKKYIEYILKVMGFAAPYKFFMVPKLTRAAADELCALLSAGVASKQISLPSTVGSLKFNAKKSINLDNDKEFKSITAAIEELGLPTDDTMDIQCFYSYTDQKTNIVVEVKFEVNIKSSYFKFTAAVPEVVVDHVLDTLVIVNNGNVLTTTEEQVKQA
ncbi:hypothetical protein LBYS11_16235 [Lysinibacillus sp. YS11]|uniref:hypothetical protein n=1 Tax=Lysinibacillus sp. YS11 TaxID=2072025 RepID=UPI000CA3E0CF|nr:hypothetical protein [Lysinibacillus sp. YS11]AUS87787.1 hypothetical protein LBYS11_16235 [Lysinibacillus sp. YS11]